MLHGFWFLPTDMDFGSRPQIRILFHGDGVDMGMNLAIVMCILSYIYIYSYQIAEVRCSSKIFAASLDPVQCVWCVLCQFHV